MIKLGIIGMSYGNGHPFSWSAIINGYFDSTLISEYGYPGISTYLEANKATLGVVGAQVTHAWTQSRQISECIAKATNIQNVVDNLEDMIGQVDAVLLSRDDPENHVSMSKPFIEAGIPIFIDKPLANTPEDLAYFKEEHVQGKFIMSCSSMRYASENSVAKMEYKALGKLELITAVGKKDWPKYGVHMLEAIFMLLDDVRPVSVKHVGQSQKDTVCLHFENGVQAVVHLFMDIAPTFQVSLFGQDSWRLIEYKNWYAMFRDNIIEFVRSVQEGKPRLDFCKTETIIRTLIAAQDSLAQDGKIIYLPSNPPK